MSQETVQNQSTESSEIKLTEEELQKLGSLFNTDQAITTELGTIKRLEYQIKERLANVEAGMKNLQEDTQSFYKEIEEKYGRGSIDINTGIFTPLPEQK